jgi:glycosyltransferase involved in cell wall biosynthesis
VVPGSLATRTGGYAYNRKIIEGLRNIGWSVTLVELSGGFPDPDEQALAYAKKCFASLPDGGLVVVDGLAFGVLPEIASPEHARLRLVALVQREKLMLSETKALGFAHHIVVTSKFTRRRLMELGVGEEKISIVEPGVIPASLSTGRDRGRGGAPMQMLCPASYIARKGHADLLRALSGLMDLPWQVICVGNGNLDARCYAVICALRAELGLIPRVDLRDEVNDSELERLYSTSDLIVLASHYEGFGMVVTEAIARGLPVVTTTGGALAETLPDGAGLASAPGDIDALKKNLCQVLSDENAYARLAEAARAARDRLSTWDKVSPRFAEALKR